MFDKLIEGLEGEDLASGGMNHLSHVLPANAEASSAYTGDDLVFGVIRRPAGLTQFAEVLNSGYLVPGRPVVFGDFRFNDDLGVIFAWNNEIRGLIEPFDAFCPFVVGGTLFLN